MPSPSTSPSPLRLGVIGCGRVFERFHLPAIDQTPDVRLVAACDSEPARLTWAAGRSPSPALTDSASELLSPSLIDAVLVLTPPASHAELTVSAVEAGIAVLVEKPMALTVEEGRRISAVAAGAGRWVQVGLARRFREPYRRLRSALEGVDRRDWRDAHFELAFSTAEWQAHTDFLGNDARGGGVLDDVVSHQVDLLSWLIGAGPEAVRVAAGGSADGLVESSSHGLRVEMRFGELTVICEAAHGHYAERLTVELVGGRRLEATGSRMGETRVASPGWRGRRARVLDRVALLEALLRRRPNVSRQSFERQLEDFARAVRGGGALGATADDGLRVLRVLAACRESVRGARGWRAVEA